MRGSRLPPVHRLFSCLVVVLFAAIAVGCIPGYAGDPGFAVWFRNDWNSPIIVQFIEPDGTNGTGFPVGAKSIGGSYLGLGVTTWSAHVRVVASDSCKLLWEQDVRSSPSGALIVDASGAVRLVTRGPDSIPEPSRVPVAAVAETKTCLPNGVEFFPQEAP